MGKKKMKRKMEKKNRNSDEEKYKKIIMKLEM